jgi:adenylate cyclase
MAKEIERRFLVLPSVKGQAMGRKTEIVQGYLSAEPAVRVRLVGGLLGKKGFITVKGPGSLTRPEFEYEVPALDAKEMLTLCKFGLEKERRHVMVSGHVWSVDFFTEPRMNGLILAEVELKGEEETFVMPEWAGEEVTENPYYSNVSLAKIGAPPRTP